PAHRVRADRGTVRLPLDSRADALAADVADQGVAQTGGAAQIARTGRVLRARARAAAIGIAERDRGRMLRTQERGDAQQLDRDLGTHEVLDHARVLFGDALADAENFGQEDRE